MPTKAEAIKKVLEDLNGVATWDQIYDNIEKYYPAARSSVAWREGIRGVLYREIKNSRNFKRIGLGVYALLDYEEEKPPEPGKKVRYHSYLEGVIIELGNLKGYQTYTPDKTAIFKDEICLGKIETLKDVPGFTYNEIISDVKKIDVIWFNSSRLSFPENAFEVVNSINTLTQAFNRFIQLSFFNLKFYIVAPEKYRERFEKKVKKNPYEKFSSRIEFRNYENIIKLYEYAMKYYKLESEVL